MDPFVGMVDTVILPGRQRTEFLYQPVRPAHPDRRRRRAAKPEVQARIMTRPARLAGTQFADLTDSSPEIKLDQRPDATAVHATTTLEFDTEPLATLADIAVQAR